MILKEISLLHFRNYNELSVKFSDGINVFLGENAQGKTNLMEAIYALSLARSPRTSNEKEMIQWQQEAAKITGKVARRHTDYPLELIFSSKGKVAKVNHLEQKKLSQYIGHLNVVLFAPEDLTLVKGAPAARRKFLDMELGQMYPVYLHDLVQYQRILKQRNTYLKQHYNQKNKEDLYLDILTEQLGQLAASIIHYRIEFIQKLEQWARPIHYEISLGKERLAISYKTSFPVTVDMDKQAIYAQLMKKLQDGRNREREQGTTLYGPHRDDVLFFVNEHNVQTFGSQGQQRTTVLSLKLAEIECMKEVIGEYPILLLDDVLSELDDNRQTHLLKSIEKKVQTFLTTTSLDGIRKNQIDRPNVYQISHGQLEMEGV